MRKIAILGAGDGAPRWRLSTASGVELPITEQFNAILNEGKPPAAAIRDIMECPSKRQ